jgi:type II secretory pathway pseudopilin PulG
MKNPFGKILLLAFVLIWKPAFAQSNTVVLNLDNETRDILLNATEDSWFKKDAFTSALLGGLTALAAVFWTDWLQRRKEHREEDEFNQRVLNAIRIELKMLLEIHDNGASGKIKDLKDGDTFNYWLHFSQKHFVIFESNASNIGKIDSELASQIIKVYGLLRVYVETMGINSRYVSDNDQTNWALQLNPTDKNLLERSKWIRSLMIEQAKELRQMDSQIRSSLDVLFALFDNLKQ